MKDEDVPAWLKDGRERVVWDTAVKMGTTKILPALFLRSLAETRKALVVFEWRGRKETGWCALCDRHRDAGGHASDCMFMTMPRAKGG